MAEIKFVLYDLSGDCHNVSNVLSFELLKSVNAPCDGLRLVYLSDASQREMKMIEAFDGDKKIFKGFCDTQQETVDSSGVINFIYARSSISLLVDNQAQPCIYQSPSLQSLFMKNAEQFGFSSNLPDIYCESLYQVSSGNSCYSAINNFVHGITKKRIMADAYDNLFLPNSKSVLNLNDYCITNEKRIVNRGQTLAMIDYKISSSDDYIYHCKSRFVEQQGIKTSKKINISSLPEWQRDYTVSSMLKDGNSKYYSVELTVDGCNYFNLYDIVQYESTYLGTLQDYYVYSVSCVCDSNGKHTKVVLCKEIDLKEIKYVD